MSKTSFRSGEKWEWLLFGLSVLGCLVGLALSVLSHDRSALEGSFSHLVFVAPSVIFFAVLIGARLRRKDVAQDTK